MTQATTVDVTAVEHFACEHCQIAHVQVTVQWVRCRCEGTGFVAVPGPWGGWDRPCTLCPGDGWVATYNGGEVDRQMRDCQVFRSWQRLDPSLTRDQYRDRVAQAQAKYQVVEVSSLDDVEAWII